MATANEMQKSDGSRAAPGASASRAFPKSGAAPGVAPRKGDRSPGRMSWHGQPRQGHDRHARASCVRTPGSLIHEPSTHMHFHHLFYGISRSAPCSPKTWQAIVQAVGAMNRRIHWEHEPLSFALERQPERTAFPFPLIRIGLPKQVSSNSPFVQAENGPAACLENSFAWGSIRTRGNRFHSHLVVAFLRCISERFPEILLELRDETGFVLAGGVWFRGGKAELNRERLNRERERVLEATGDPNAAAPYLWAEAEALQGRFFVETAASEYAHEPLIEALEMSMDELDSMGLGQAADTIVKAVLSETPAFQA